LNSKVNDEVEIIRNDVRFEAFTVVTMKNAVVWDVALCRSCVNRRFAEKYRLHLQGRRIRERGTSVSRWLQIEPPVGNNQLYKNRERGRVCHMGIQLVAQPAVTCSRWYTARGFFYLEDGGDTFLRNVV
jgi:hypothetical protein